MTFLSSECQSHISKQIFQIKCIHKIVYLVLKMSEQVSVLNFQIFLNLKLNCVRMSKTVIITRNAFIIMILRMSAEDPQESINLKSANLQTRVSVHLERSATNHTIEMKNFITRINTKLNSVNHTSKTKEIVSMVNFVHLLILKRRYLQN